MPPDARIWKNVLQEHMAWCERVLIQPYQTRHKENPPTEEELSMIRKALESMVEKPELGDNLADFFPQAAAIYQKNKDPLFAFAYAAIQNTRKFHGDAISALDTALPLAKTLPATKALAWLIARAKILSRLTPVIEESASADMVVLTRDILQDGSFTGAEYDIFAQLFLGAEMDDYRSHNLALYEPLVELPQLPLWVRETLRGQNAVTKAWQMRGDAFADSVTDDGWKGFSQHLKAARQSLTQAWQLHPDSPLAATKMISVVMGGEERPGETVRTWFDRATQAQFDYSPAYNHLLWAYRPRWGGSIEKIIDFAKACATTGRMDTDVPTMFYRATSGLVLNEKLDWQEVFRGRADVARLMVSLSQQRLDEPTRQRNRVCNLGLLAANAFLAGDFATAQAARLQLPDAFPRAIQDKLWSFHIPYDVFEQQIKLATLPGGAESSAAEKFVTEGQIEKALQYFSLALEKIPTDQRAMLQTRADQVRLKYDYESGKWTRLEPDRTKSYWFFSNNVYDAWFYGSGDGRAPSLMQKLNMDLGDNLQVRGDFVLPTKTSARFVCAFHLANRNKGFDSSPGWIQCRIASTITEGVFSISVSDIFGKKLVADTTMALGPIVRTELRLQNKHFSLKINDRLIVDNITAPKHTNSAEEVIFGFAIPPAVDAEAKIWEIRKLPQEAKPFPHTSPVQDFTIQSA